MATPLLLPPRYYFAERTVSFIRGRLRRLERRADHRCPECSHKPERSYVYYPDEGQEAPEPPACTSCGRSLGFVIKVVYEGEGVSPIG
jgi:predicted RNA-binding Zn-ribbon protein involved in translation (DUF1610 family)